MLLIDTYNVLHVTGVLPPHLAGIELSGLAGLIGASRWKNRDTLLVCDGTGGGMVKSRRLITPDPEYPNIVAMFVGPSRDADSALERRLDEDSAPRRLLVVSSDNRLKAAARRKRADWLSSEAFLEKLVLDEARRGKVPLQASPAVPLDEGEIRAWLRAFGYDDAVVEGDNDGPEHHPRAIEESVVPEAASPTPGEDDAILREAQEEWPGRVDPDDLDMHRWMDEQDNSKPEPETEPGG